ncbi:MAG: isoprenoid biosynthesis glyoxalase ElbB [Alphaproteobacteria bacterium]|nr:isoprenoid biosynthesis glyoxalase ElbB [Alphaproteobacteria bacterium]
MKNMPRFAVILSGCGRADGSEIHEAVTALLAIDRAGCTYQCFAPDIEQAAVINNLTSEKMEERRNVLVESARIARGKIKPLAEFKTSEFDCIIFPGGLGAITNWCDFAQKGIKCTVETSVHHILEEAYHQNLVIGAMCIAPVLIAKVLGKYGIKVTIGKDKAVAAAIEATGAEHENRKADEVCIDEENYIVTTPAYMLAKSITEVALGAEKMIKEIIRITKER